jgi:hypothetical protein
MNKLIFKTKVTKNGKIKKLPYINNLCSLDPIIYNEEDCPDLGKNNYNQYNYKLAEATINSYPVFKT